MKACPKQSRAEIFETTDETMGDIYIKHFAIYDYGLGERYQRLKSLEMKILLTARNQYGRKQVSHKLNPGPIGKRNLFSRLFAQQEKLSRVHYRYPPAWIGLCDPAEMSQDRTGE